MKYIFTLLFFTTLTFCLSAQQPAQYSLYMMNQLNWNPAYAGLDHSLSVTGGFRRQWAGFDDAPTTQYLDVHLPVYFLQGGFGLTLENDALGAERYTSAMAAYNYQMYVGSGILSFGLAAGIAQRTLDGSKLRTPEGTYTEPGSIEHNDDLLPLINESATATTFNAGVYFQTEKIEAGLGLRHINEPQVALSQLNLQLVRNYFFTFGLHLDLNSTFTLHPSVMVRADLIQLQTDISAIVKYNDNIFGGASFRGYNSNSIDAIAIIAGFKLTENIILAYAYDLPLSDLKAVNDGSHEIMINYNLNKRIGAGRPPSIIYNPRSL